MAETNEINYSDQIDKLTDKTKSILTIKTNVGAKQIPNAAWIVGYVDNKIAGGNTALENYLTRDEAKENYFTLTSATDIIGATKTTTNPFQGKTATIDIGGIKKNTQFTEDDTILSVINKLLFPTVPLTFKDTAEWDKSTLSFDRMGSNIPYFKSIIINFTKGSSNIKSIKINDANITNYDDSSATYDEGTYREFTENGNTGNKSEEITIPVVITTEDNKTYSHEYKQTYTFNYVNPKIGAVTYSGDNDYNYGTTGTLNITASATVTKGTNELKTIPSPASIQIITTNDSTTLSGTFTAIDTQNQKTEKSYNKTVYCKYPYYIGLLKQGEDFSSLSINTYKKSSELIKSQTFSNSWQNSSHVVFAFHERFNVDNVKIVDANNAIATSAFTKIKEETIGNYKYNILYLTIPAIAQETVSYTLTGLTLIT